MAENAVSRRSIDEWYDRFAEGGRITCLANQVWSPERFREKLLGREFVYISGKNEIRVRPVGGEGDFWTRRPKRVSDVLALSDEEITYVIRDGLSCTWRYLAPRPLPAEVGEAEGDV